MGISCASGASLEGDTIMDLIEIWIAVTMGFAVLLMVVTAWL